MHFFSDFRVLCIGRSNKMEVFTIIKGILRKSYCGPLWTFDCITYQKIVARKPISMLFIYVVYSKEKIFIFLNMNTIVWWLELNYIFFSKSTNIFFKKGPKPLSMKVLAWLKRLMQICMIWLGAKEVPKVEGFLDLIFCVTFEINYLNFDFCW